MNRGLFVSVESIDGLGKTTQVFKLAETLRNYGFDVIKYREPGSSNIGQGVRDLLFVNPTTKKMHPGVADCLFLADHVQAAGDIAGFVAEGKVVICDRYADSQFAYAASGTKGSPQWCLDAYEAAFGIVPDITVLLVAKGPAVPNPDVLPFDSTIEDISWALERAQARRGVEAGKQEGKRWNDLQSQRKIQEAYRRNLVGQARTVVIPVWEDQSIDTVHDAIMQGILQTGKLRIENFGLVEEIKAGLSAS